MNNNHLTLSRFVSLSNSYPTEELSVICMRGGSLEGNPRQSWKKCPVTLLTQFTIQLLERCRTAVAEASPSDDNVPSLESLSANHSSLYTKDRLFYAFSKIFMTGTDGVTTEKDLPLVWVTSPNDATKHWGAAREADISSLVNEPPREVTQHAHDAASARRLLPMPGGGSIHDSRPYPTVAPEGAHDLKDIYLKTVMRWSSLYCNTIMHLRFYLYTTLQHCAETGTKWTWRTFKDPSVHEKFGAHVTPKGHRYEHFFDTEAQGKSAISSLYTKYMIKHIQTAQDFIYWDPDIPSHNMNDLTANTPSKLALRDKWSLAIEGFDHEVITSIFDKTSPSPAILTFGRYTHLDSLGDEDYHTNGSITEESITREHCWSRVEYLMGKCYFTSSVVSSLMDAKLLWCYGRTTVWKTFVNGKNAYGHEYTDVLSRFTEKYRPPELQYFATLQIKLADLAKAEAEIVQDNENEGSGVDHAEDDDEDDDEFDEFEEFLARPR
jgi:hypothetical protein